MLSLMREIGTGVVEALGYIGRLMFRLAEEGPSADWQRAGCEPEDRTRDRLASI
jgi:hypothetical protein